MLGLAAGQPDKTIKRVIVIGDDGGGHCVVLASPTDIRAAKRNNKIVWTVTNNCNVTKTVTVGNFTHQGQKKEPLQLRSASPIKAGQSGELEGKIKVLPHSDLGEYKYDVLIDGVVAVDPMLEIDS
jgi:hypothetical protein